MTVATASSGAPSVVVSESGAKGLSGTDGTDGSGFNQVRKGLLNNPLFRGFMVNRLQDVSAPNDVEADITLARASTATYVDRYGVVQTAGVDTPREESEGWLIEGASTNLILQSEFASGWTSVNSTLTPNNSIAPDGTTTAARLASTGVSGRITQSVVIINGNTYTGSVWIKHVSGTGSLGISDTDGAYTYTTPSNSAEWTRIKVTNASTSTTGRLYFLINDSSSVYDIWGAQLEEISHDATSYIPTTSAGVSRSPDLVEIDVLNNIPNFNGITIVATTDINGDDFPSLFWSVTDPSDFGFRLIHRTDNNIVQGFLGSSAGQNIQTGVLGTKYNYILTQDGDGVMVSYVDGIQSSSGSPIRNRELILTNKLFIGNKNGLGVQPMYGHIKNLEIHNFTFNADEAMYMGTI